MFYEIKLDPLQKPPQSRRWKQIGKARTKNRGRMLRQYLSFLLILGSLLTYNSSIQVKIVLETFMLILSQASNLISFEIDRQYSTFEHFHSRARFWL